MTYKPTDFFIRRNGGDGKPREVVMKVADQPGYMGLIETVDGTAITGMVQHHSAFIRMFSSLCKQCLKVGLDRNDPILSSIAAATLNLLKENYPQWLDEEKDIQ